MANIRYKIKELDATDLMNDPTKFKEMIDAIRSKEKEKQKKLNFITKRIHKSKVKLREEVPQKGYYIMHNPENGAASLYINGKKQFIGSLSEFNVGSNSAEQKDPVYEAIYGDMNNVTQAQAVYSSLMHSNPTSRTGSNSSSIGASASSGGGAATGDPSNGSHYMPMSFNGSVSRPEAVEGLYQNVASGKNIYDVPRNPQEHIYVNSEKARKAAIQEAALAAVRDVTASEVKESLPVPMRKIRLRNLTRQPGQ